MSSAVLIDSMETMRRIVEAVRFVEHLRRTAIPLSPETPPPPMSLVSVHVVVSGSTPSAYGFYPAVVQRVNTELNTGWYNELPAPMEVRVREIDGLLLYPGFRYAGIVVGDLSDAFGEDEGYTAVIVDRDYIEPGCGLKINPTDGSYYVDPGDFLIDDCFLIDYTDPYCPVVTLDPECLASIIFVTEVISPFLGCGLEFAGGVIRVKRTDLVGNNALTSLVVGPGACDLAVDLDDVETEVRTIGGRLRIERIAGGKLQFTQPLFRDRDYWNAAGLHIDRLVTPVGDAVTVVDICDVDCCDDCTITAGLSADEEVIDVGDAITFTATASGCTGPYTFVIDFGDGSPEEQLTGTSPQVFVHTYTEIGEFIVRMTVWDDCGRASAEQTVAVFAVTDSAGCDFGYSLYLTTVSSGGANACLGSDLLNDPLAADGPVQQSVTHGGGLKADGCEDDDCGYSVTVLCVGDGTYTVGRNSSYSGPPTTTGLTSSGGIPGSGTFHLSFTYPDTDLDCAGNPKSITIHIRDFTV